MWDSEAVKFLFPRLVWQREYRLTEEFNFFIKQKEFLIKSKGPFRAKHHHNYSVLHPNVC